MHELSSPVIRTARPDDAPEVLDIERECFREVNTRLLRRLCGSVEGFLVCDVSREVAGYVVATPRSSDTARIVSLAVRRPYRRLGVATGLMLNACERMRRRDVDRVELEVRVSNGGARSLYEGLGFESVAMKPEYYTDGENAYLMELDL